MSAFRNGLTSPPSQPQANTLFSALHVPSAMRSQSPAHSGNSAIRSESKQAGSRQSKPLSPQPKKDPSSAQEHSQHFTSSVFRQKQRDIRTGTNMTGRRTALGTTRTRERLSSGCSYPSTVIVTQKRYKQHRVRILQQPQQHCAKLLRLFCTFVLRAEEEQLHPDP